MAEARRASAGWGANRRAFAVDRAKMSLRYADGAGSASAAAGGRGDALRRVRGCCDLLGFLALPVREMEDLLGLS